MSIRIDSGELESLLAGVFGAIGCEADEARTVARHLVGANLVGHDSHGAVRVVPYIERLSAGQVFANRRPRAVVDAGALLGFDGDGGFGQSIVETCVAAGIERAREHGIALLGVRNVAHLGRLGHYAEQAAAAGVISVHFVNTTGFAMVVAPYGGVQRRLPTNPVSIGMPRQGKTPVIWDVATSAVAEGKVKLAAIRNEPVPEGAMIDADGKPTTDPGALAAGGAILPFGGHKGYGLAVMCDLLAGVLSGGGCAKPGATHMVNNMVSFLVDRRAFEVSGAMDEEIEGLCNWVKSAEPAPGFGPVLVPGEIEDNTRRQRRDQGIPFEEADWRQIVGAALAVGIAQEMVPQPL